MSEFFVIYIKTLDCGGFQFYQTLFLLGVLEVTGMEHCNWLPITTKVEAPLEAYDNILEANLYWPNSYACIIEMIFIWYQIQYQVSPMLFISVHILSITLSRHIRLL